MKNKQTGRPIDLSGINIHELDEWLSTNKMARKILICKAIIALNRRVKTTEVCNILDKQEKEYDYGRTNSTGKVSGGY